MEGGGKMKLWLIITILFPLISSAQIMRVGSATTQTLKVRPASDFTNGLSAWWKFDDGSGIVATDFKGVNNGTLTNGVGWTASSILGPFAITNDGVNDFVYTLLNAHYLNSTFAVSGWFNTTNNAFQALVANGGSTNGWGVFINAGRLNLSIRDSSNTGSTTRNRETTGTFTNGTWNHFVAVFTVDTAVAGNNAVTLYTNGTLASLTTLTETANPASAATPSTVSIGSRRFPQSPTTFFTGRQDDTRIYTNTVTAGQASLIYNAPNNLNGN